MQKVLTAALLTAATLMTTPAMAADGCGPGRFRYSLFGHCHWERPLPTPPGAYGPPPGAYGYGPGAYAPPPGGGYYAGPTYGPGPEIVIDRWYPGRGYWDGNRYWWHRHHWRGGWRYY